MPRYIRYIALYADVAANAYLYHYFVSRDGTARQVRALSKPATGTARHNAHTLSVCYELQPDGQQRVDEPADGQQCVDGPGDGQQRVEEIGDAQQRVDGSGDPADRRTPAQKQQLLRLVTRLITVYRCPACDATDLGAPMGAGLDVKGEFLRIYRQIVGLNR